MTGNHRKSRPVVRPLRLSMVCVVFAASWAVLSSGVILQSHVTAASVPSFNSDVAPILQKNCFACHTSTTKMGDLVMESYNSLMKGGTHGSPIVPHNARGSRLALM